MKLRFSTKILALAAAFVALPAHADDPAPAAQTEAGHALSAREKLAYDASKPLGTPIPEGYQPPFTQETVTKLNAIMKRSIATLDEFDRLNEDLAAARETGNSARITEISTRFGELVQEATAAKTDFMAEKEALIARKEYYDENMMAAMEYYVEQAPVEISEALAAKAG